ncbi:MAG: hypothetical protein AB8G23_10520 [Myxococcota bacterium]
MSMSRTGGVFLLGVVLFAAGCASGPSTQAAQAAQASETTKAMKQTRAPLEVSRDAAIMAVLDRYMDALNALDLEGHVATYHFPHYRHASGEITVWAEPRDIGPLFDVPQAERQRRLRSVLEPDWHRSVWTQRDIVQGDEGKVHVVTRFERQREDGSMIKAYNSLYIMTLQDGVWGIKGRSSFAP